MITKKTHMAIAGNNLVSFVAGMSVQEKEDILDLLLHADFFASQAYDQHVHWKSWLDYYRNRMVKHGCQLKSQILRAPVVITDSCELDRLTFKVVGTEGSAKLARLVQASFNAIRVNEYAQAFFRRGTGAGRIGSFQIVPCERTANGEIRVFLCALRINALAVIDDSWFWDNTHRDLVLHLVGGVYAFSTARYAPFREQIRTKLVQNSTRFIQDIEL
ncbi:hypothetical protein QN386_06485 [Pseudomonas sp. CCI3.2]|uniref:hypothetical protein n=1 Tax=unclassified Pseudomonas TaxID=196821 RepID=UPI002AC976AB|nr:MULTISPECIES: hypothetical protein [unclassified Pseudomonas]MEB0079951.1 hypothetical protein [Pseudomonas sp. MH10out]MEB0100973.1 hypothetical protein [Pseudomonas sp. CCI3.2]MEB0156858.1 hypothetical protein [Pseudomonas sp. AH2 (2023)]MEB0166781.1 hypothetical protein [Pseudomonas sp. CCC4.4]WPX28606.1 hypothetical protein RHM64_02750 [Pseudomonas sp. AH2]